MDTQLQELGTLVGVLAVIISIVALAFQIRQNTGSLRSQNYGKALDRLADVQARLSSDPAANSVLNRGVRDSRALAPDEKAQFAWMFYEIFGAFEFIFDEAQRGALPPHVWERWGATLAWWISLPGVQDWWRSKPTPFNRDFSALVDECIRAPKVDVAAAKRWQQFMQE